MGVIYTGIYSGGIYSRIYSGESYSGIYSGIYIGVFIMGFKVEGIYSGIYSRGIYSEGGFTVEAAKRFTCMVYAYYSGWGFTVEFTVGGDLQ